MNMGTKLAKAFNEQINREYYSAFLYLAMSAWLNEQDLPGAAKWMYVQYQEELVHAQGLVKYLMLRGDKVDLMPIEAPKKEWTSPLNAFEEALEHERQVTKWIDDLAKMAEEEGDRAARLFLDWYILEQVEEEANGEENVVLWGRAGDAPSGIMMLDVHYGQRGFSPDEIPHLD